MSWQDIIKDSRAANAALEMDFFMNNLEKALKYETQDIRFADFGTKQKVLDIAKKDIFSINEIWDNCIDKKKIVGLVSEANFFHATNLKIYEQLKDKNFEI